jgi:membrane peptidoglycan carboxypeptidase
MPARRRKLIKRLLVGFSVVLIVGLIYAVMDELQTSRLQAERLGRLASELHFKVEPGPSDSIRFPGSGPYDERLGYRSIPKFVEQLRPQGYVVTAQARMSPRLVELSDQGLFSPYREKDQAGLELRDCRSEALFAARFPQRVYERFESVPPLLVDALLFIENRELLNPQYPNRNPAIEWTRLGRAATDRARHLVDDAHPSPGGSTLATQIEKYRHSPEGRTESMKEKLRQMASASVRAYLDGENTLPARRRIVVEYLNTVPLSAQSGFGEVNGLGDGLWAWYGRDFAEVNRLLMTVDGAGGSVLVPVELMQRRALAFRHVLLIEQAQAFKQALSLMVAQRRPSHYLGDGATSLAELTNSYLRVMAEAGVIGPGLRDAALPLRLELLPQSQPPPVSFIERKAVTAARAKLSGLLGMPRAYDVDRLDLRADSSLDGAAQFAATRLLRSLKDPAAAKAAGLYGFHLLNEGDDPGKLTFSFTLFERGEHANQLRVQADNHDQPFDINEGAKLDLGSTAKLRTLVTYLELVAQLHDRWGGLSAEELAALEVDRRDAIGRWVREFLSRQGHDRSRTAMLEAALERSYSANPAEGFFTGGGLHHFENFEPKDNRRVMTVREALKHSVNLVFIRLMRDVVYHVMSNASGASTGLLEDQGAPQRRDYLARFADREGRAFSARFYRKYRGKSAQDAEDLLLQGVRATPARLASVFRSLEPEAGPDRLAKFMAPRLGAAGVSEPELRVLHERYGPDRMSLVDRGYTAGVHPLELWLVGYLRHHPGATLREVQAASSAERQAVYAWLFKTRHKDAQDVRIRSLLEREAFLEIHRAWQRLGYPFESLTPSYATAIGASGDRPAALAELMGIIVNRGLRLPAARIASLEFARDTPYETRLAYQAPPAERVLPAEVADSVRRALRGVVEGGTAQRLNRALVRRDGTLVEIGGKTGTGDHRFDVFGRGGKLISSRVIDRSATFVFFIGERHFGTMMIYVHEPDAVKYRFTSALPAQLLKTLLPVLQPLLDSGVCGTGNATGG